MTTEQKKFIEKIYRYAVGFGFIYGFPFPSICIAQAIHESGWGTSFLSVNNLNFFGIKLNHEGISDIFTIGNATEEVNGKDMTTSGTKWAKFRTVSDAVEGYYKYLTVWTHYAPAFKMTSREDCVRHIGKTYATRTGYADKILKIIKDYGLDVYDVYDLKSFTLDNNLKIGDTVTLLEDLKVGDKIELSQDVGISISEDKAKKGVTLKTYRKGTYYVYKISNGCINITGNSKSPGGWIVFNPSLVNLLS